MFRTPPVHNPEPAKAASVVASLGERASVGGPAELSDADVEKGNQAAARLEKAGPDATEVARDEFDSANRLLGGPAKALRTGIASSGAPQHAHSQQLATFIHNEYPKTSSLVRVTALVRRLESEGTINLERSVGEQYVS